MSNLIETYETAGIFDAALQLTRKYLELYPNNEDSFDKKIKIGVLYQRLGYNEQSVLHLQTLLDQAGSDLEGEIRYYIAEANYNKGDFQQAILDFLKVPYLVTKRGKMDWTANSLYMAGQSYEKLGRFDLAAKDLERMLDEREVAHLSGSYQRPRYSPALLRLAILYRDRLKDKERARQAFHRLYADFATSTLRDDALWQEASLWREDGDTGTACERLASLAEDIPDSRYVPCAMQLCPRVKRAKDSRAPTECHPYILRAAQ
jgi:tetratricopeptide (TPR) repeat protein